MKKILCLLIVAVMSLTALAGCGNTAASTTPDGNGNVSTSPTTEWQGNNSTSHTTEWQGNSTTPTTSTTNDVTLPGGSNDSWMKSLSGTERAKLLLASQRLNETVLNTDGNIFEDGEKIMNNLIDIALDNLGVQYADKEELPPMSEGNTTVETIVDEHGTTINIGDKTVSWSGFPEINNSYGFFLSMTDNIVNEAKAGAELIAFVKKNIRVVNKWVDFGGVRYYLAVDANSEALYQYYAQEDGIQIIERYKNEDGKDVYEMYRRFGEYENRTLYIPGERYEYTDSYQYFTAENSKGYWEVYSGSEVSEHYNASYFIMKDNICYDAIYDAGNGTINMLKVMSEDRKADILNIFNNYTLIDLKFSGFDGIDYVETPREDMHSSVWSGEEDIAYTTTKYETVSAHMLNGKVIRVGDTYCNGMVSVDRMMVSHYSMDGYHGEMGIRISSPNGELTYSEKISLLRAFLDEVGLTCRRNIDGILSGIDLAYEELDGITKYFCWNGINVSTEAGIAEAIAKEKVRLAALYAKYEAIKNEEVIEYTTPEDMEIHISFAPIANISANGASVNGTKVTVPSVALTVNDTVLYVKDEPYMVSFALKANDGSLIHLDITNETTVKYAEEKEFTVNAENASFELPEIAPGEYTVVCYISTADGIRASGYTELAFEKAEGLPVTLSSSELSAAIGEGGALTVTYIEKLDHYVSVSTVNALDFAGFKALIGEEAFKYGTPKDDVIEKLVDEEYTALTGEETEIESGTYRIFYSAKNGNATRMGYVYISYVREMPNVITSKEAPSYSDFKAKLDEVAAANGISEYVIEKLVGEEYTALTGEETAVDFGAYRMAYTVNDGEKDVTEYLYIDLVQEEVTPEEVPSEEVKPEEVIPEEK